MADSTRVCACARAPLTLVAHVCLRVVIPEGLVLYSRRSNLILERIRPYTTVPAPTRLINLTSPSLGPLLICNARKTTHKPLKPQLLPLHLQTPSIQPLPKCTCGITLLRPGWVERRRLFNVGARGADATR